jgi:TetR/AcrR family acrAB operon transcriptional repressor
MVVVTVDSSLIEQPSQRARQAAATRQRLIDAAARLFATKGYAASSVSAIGAKAGVSRGLVNFHFATKENLLHAVIQQLVTELEEQMFPPDPPGAPLEALAVLVHAHHNFLTQRPERARLLFRLQAEALNPSLGVKDFSELHQRWLERTRSWWEEGLVSGEIDPTLSHDAVTTFTIGALRGIALEWLLAPDALDIESAYAHLLRSLRTGLSPRAEGATP